MRICREFENWRDLRALSGKFLRQKSCYPESFCFLWLWEAGRAGVDQGGVLHTIVFECNLCYVFYQISFHNYDKISYFLIFFMLERCHSSRCRQESCANLNLFYSLVFVFSFKLFNEASSDHCFMLSHQNVVHFCQSNNKWGYCIYGLIWKGPASHF